MRARHCACSTTAAASAAPARIDFKKNWGFEPEPLAYEYRLLRRDDVPQNNPLNPKYRAFIALWRRLPRACRQRPRAACSCAISVLTRWRNLLYLVHRIPYPPNKGDKVRSYHIC